MKLEGPFDRKQTDVLAACSLNSSTPSLAMPTRTLEVKIHDLSHSLLLQGEELPPQTLLKLAGICAF